MKKSVVTLEKLKEFDSVMEAIQWARQQGREYPKKPSKPFLKHGANSEEALNYANSLVVYEKEMVEYKKTNQEYTQEKNDIEGIVIDFIKDAAGLDTVPEQYRNKVYSKAYDYGHSDGLYEVYLKLESLIEIFD